MTREIHNLDTSMQNLVYENYNKFISATDTIRQMKRNVEAMEEKMNTLGQSMQHISTVSDGISTTLSAHREEIGTLSSVHRLVKRLQFVFELPARLTKCIEMEAYKQAVRYYQTSVIILEKYNDVPSFRAILTECNGIMDALKKKLKERIKSHKTSIADTAESVELLLALKESRKEVMDLYTDCRRSVMLQLLRDSDQLYKAGPQASATGEGASEKNFSHRVIGHLHQGFLHEFREFATGFQRLFVASASGEEASKAVETIKQCTTDLFRVYFELVTLVLNQFPGEISDLVLCVEDIALSVERVHRSFVELGLVSQIVVLSRAVVRVHVDKAFSEFSSQQMSAIMAADTLLATQSPHQVLDTLLSATLSQFQSMLVSLKPFHTHTAKLFKNDRATFLSLVYTRLQNFFFPVQPQCRRPSCFSTWCLLT
eukprot:TRINITY_DN1172_c0_g1_i2.p1 TRINITY_DN1172_c0_g1~~TRINITY_DN1172_c0_g1_i2.p1  ORF type:complete len:491 (+),score=142.78 TRINITY_DN1172_c0_g1_i2:191-1474(+)